MQLSGSAMCPFWSSVEALIGTFQRRLNPLFVFSYVLATEYSLSFQTAMCQKRQVMPVLLKQLLIEMLCLAASYVVLGCLEE